MMDKKGIELSLNFLIVMIISVVVLFGGIYFTTKFMDVVKDREASIDEQMEAQIKALLAGGQQVAIPIDMVTIKKGGNGIFGLGIRNTLKDGTDQFRIAIQFKRAYDRLDNEMDGSDGLQVPDEGFINENWIFGTKDGVQTIASNRYELIPILISVGGSMGHNRNTREGLYEFNVCVCPCRDTGTDICDDSITSYCIDRCHHDPDINLGALYGGHIMKLYVDVP